MTRPFLGASVTWAFAVLGAIGIARWLQLSSQDTILLVIAVAVIAVLGAFIPVLRLGHKSKI